MEDIEKIFIENESKEIELEFEGKKIPIQIRELSWSEKNQILSQCFTYQMDGNISFNFDRYMKMALTKIITKAPWGETNLIFLSKIKPSFGAILEKLAPRAFEEIKTSDFFTKE